MRATGAHPASILAAMPLGLDATPARWRALSRHGRDPHQSKLLSPPVGRRGAAPRHLTSRLRDVPAELGADATGRSAGSRFRSAKSSPTMAPATKSCIDWHTSGPVPAGDRWSGRASSRPVSAGQDMLEVGCRRSGRADDGRIERTTRCCECAQQCEAGSDLEPRRSNVPVWDAVADPVQDEPEESGAESRACERAACRAGGHVHRHDHSGSVCRRIRVRPEARRPGTSPSRQSPPLLDKDPSAVWCASGSLPKISRLHRLLDAGGWGHDQKSLGQRRRAFAGVVAVTLVGLAVGVAQALADGTGTATSPLERRPAGRKRA